MLALQLKQQSLNDAPGNLYSFWKNSPSPAKAKMKALYFEGCSAVPASLAPRYLGPFLAHVIPSRMLAIKQSPEGPDQNPPETFHGVLLRLGALVHASFRHGHEQHLTGSNIGLGQKASD